LPPTTADILSQLCIVGAAAGVGATWACLSPRILRQAGPDRSRGRAAVLLGAAAALFAATFTYLAIKRFDAFHAAAVDLGIQHQVFWAGGRGAFLYQTVLFARSHFNHVALVNQLLSPLSLAFPSARVLLVIQGLALASAAVPAYLIARRFTASRYLALAFGLSPLLFASTQWVALYDFHPRTLAPALVLWGFWGMETARPRAGLLSFFFAALLLEEMALYTCAAGLFVALGLKQRRWGLLVAAFSAFHFLVATYLIYPQLMDVGDVSSNPILNTFGVARSPLGLAAYALRHPLEFLSRAAEPARWSYVLHMATPWGFLPAAAGWGWLTYVTPAVYALFSKVPSHYDIQYQYAMPPLPFLVYFAARVWGRIEGRLRDRPAAAATARRGATAFLILAGAGAAVAFGPLGVRYDASRYRPAPETRRFADVAPLVSRDGSLAATSFELPHFSGRERIFLYPVKFDYVEKLLPYEVIVRASPFREPWLEPHPQEETTGRYLLTELLRDGRYGCAYADGDYVLLRRGASAVIPPGKAFAWTFRIVEDDRLNNNVGVVVYDGRARDYRAVYCRANQGKYGAMARAGPRYWPAGAVKVNYRLAVEKPRRPFARVAEMVIVEHRPTQPPAAVAVRDVYPAELPSGGYGRASVAFDSKIDCEYEFLLYPSGNGDLLLDYIFVEAPTLTLERAFRKAETEEERSALAAAAAEYETYLAAAPSGYVIR
jgi:uncharacterized membrane protein